MGPGAMPMTVPYMGPVPSASCSLFPISHQHEGTIIAMHGVELFNNIDIRGSSLKATQDKLGLEDRELRPANQGDHTHTHSRPSHR